MRVEFGDGDTGGAHVFSESASRIGHDLDLGSEFVNADEKGYFRFGGGTVAVVANDEDFHDVGFGRKGGEKRLR